MKRAEKAFFVDNLAEELKTAKGIILLNYSGLSVKLQQELKKRLKEVSSKMIVVKNTLLKRAGNMAKIDSKVLEDSVLSGQNALVIANDDPISPIQVLGKFNREFKIPKIRVGIIEGIFQNEEALQTISLLPGKDALLGQVLGSLIFNFYSLTRTLNANLEKLLFILDQKAKS